MVLTLVTASASGFLILHLIFFVPFIGAALAQVAFVRCPFSGADFSEHA
jgi:hypothetical protein